MYPPFDVFCLAILIHNLKTTHLVHTSAHVYLKGHPEGIILLIKQSLSGGYQSLTTESFLLDADYSPDFQAPDPDFDIGAHC